MQCMGLHSSCFGCCFEGLVRQHVDTAVAVVAADVTQLVKVVTRYQTGVTLVPADALLQAVPVGCQQH